MKEPEVMRQVRVDGEVLVVDAAGQALAQAMALEIPMVMFSTGSTGCRYHAVMTVVMPDGTSEEVTFHATIVVKRTLRGRR
jgi:hypothetical protein